MPSYRVLLFSYLRERAGTSELELEVDTEPTVAELLSLAAEEVAVIATMKKNIRIAVNLEYASPDVVVRQGDEIAFITPTSGG